jgi:arylsulfatase A-like enzyme
MGFEYFYGFMGGDASQWQPNLYRNTTAIYPFEGNPGWNLTTAMADEAIQYMKGLKAVAPEKPFLVYYVPGGTHARTTRRRSGSRRSATCICSTRAGTRCARPSSPTRSGWASCPPRLN